jgi:hypothetical protein
MSSVVVSSSLLAGVGLVRVAVIPEGAGPFKQLLDTPGWTSAVQGGENMDLVRVLQGPVKTGPDSRQKYHFSAPADPGVASPHKFLC